MRASQNTTASRITLTAAQVKARLRANRQTLSGKAFRAACRAALIPEPVPECRFHPTRRWRFDYAWPEQKVALEVEGGVWTRGRHTRGAGFLADLSKYNSAVLLGWKVIRTTPDKLVSAETLAMLRELGLRAAS